MSDNVNAMPAPKKNPITPDYKRAKSREYYEQNKLKQNALRKQKYHWERAIIKIVLDAVEEGLTECPEFIIPEKRPLEDFYPKEGESESNSD